MDEFQVELTNHDAKLFVLLAYLTAGNWDVEEVAGGVEYLKELDKPKESNLRVIDNDH